MKNINVVIIGYGKMGKIYAKEINDNKKFKLVDIITKKKINQNYKILNLFLKKKIDLIIIASPIETHFNYLKLAIKNNKNIILEKPIVKDLEELKKLIKISKLYKRKILIHHNDVINLENQKSFINKKKLKKIKMIYGKKDKKQKATLPHLDWLPHPLSVITYFFGKPSKFKILDYRKIIKNNLIIENLKLTFDFKKNSIYLNFSNNINKPSKEIFFLEKNKMKKIYDGYNKKNQRSIKHLLNKYIKSNRINDINSNIETYKLLFKISSKIKSINNV